MQRTAHPVSWWVRPVLVALIAIEGLVGAGATVAASNPTHGSTTADAPLSFRPVAPVAALAPSGSYDESVVTGRATPPPAPVSPATVRPAATAKPKTESTAPKTQVTTKKTTSTSKPPTTGYHGVYRLWIPALGLSRGISDWGCNGGLIPNRVEYWGCAGHNNLYLLGHAWGVFAPIHDGYHSGALHAGLTAWFADKSGKVSKYRVAWVRHVALKDYASWSTWAMVSSSSRIITLQTCDGSTSAYRILVRLVPA